MSDYSNMLLEYHVRKSFRCSLLFGRVTCGSRDKSVYVSSPTLAQKMLMKRRRDDHDRTLQKSAGGVHDHKVPLLNMHVILLLFTTTNDLHTSIVVVINDNLVLDTKTKGGENPSVRNHMFCT